MAESLRVVAGKRDFERALNADELSVHFQPVIRLDTGAVRGAEALLRWKHPELGLLPAAAFLPQLEDTPFITRLTSFVLQRACRTIAEHAPADWSVAVNVTAADACREELVEQVTSALADSGLAASRLILEITETGLLGNHTDCVGVLTRLRELGVTIALDDFGTGYSSLSMVRELPITELKIDAVFVAAMESRSTDAAIVTSIIRLAESIGATVVAEGVEKQSQAALLSQLGCGFAQGYLWSQAEPIDEVIKLRPMPFGRGMHLGTPSAVTKRVIVLSESGASAHTIAGALNADGLRTPTGKRWHPSSVADLLRRQESTSS